MLTYAPTHSNGVQSHAFWHHVKLLIDEGGLFISNMHLPIEVAECVC